MNIGSAPSWTVVFIFAAVWNALVERCWWGVAVCIGLAVAYEGKRYIDRRITSNA